ncbi:hypothetical protein AJ87_14275 [Rhizobium yanglingense]|nr:hypothetical protein AJ87_14275 [Rhizobium yanglingense]
MRSGRDLGDNPACGLAADLRRRAQLLIVIAGNLLLMLAALLIADRLDRFLGVTGRAILTRLLGVILAALAAQFVVDGVKAAMAIS